MAKGKYQKWIEPDGLILLEGWARDGLTDAEIAGKMNISQSTLYDWKNRFPEISEALKKGKEVVDRMVENALLRKAMGYNAEIRKAIKLKEVEYSDEGKKIGEYERVEYVTETMHVPADTTAQIFWLKNRKPQQWQDHPNVDADQAALEKLDDLLGEFRDAVTKPETD